MKTRTLIGCVCLAVLAGCGLEEVLFNARHRAFQRPASTIRGAVSWPGATPEQLTVLDGDGNAVEPFEKKIEGSVYELRLPSSKYSMLRVQGHAGNFILRALVPSLAEESTVDEVHLDARAVTEVLVVEARLSAERKSLNQVDPVAYAGDGVTNGTRTVLRAALDVPGPTQDLLRMVERFMVTMDVASLTPDFFFAPAVLTTGFAVTRSPINGGYLALNPFDYDGVPGTESTTAKFDTKLADVAKLYQPMGCDDPEGIRVVFEVDFNAGAQDGNCATVNRFKWVTDKPGKKMYFTGGIHEDSAISAAARPDVHNLLGAWVPNQVQMYDDGTNGDAVAGDNVWTITFGLPRGLRLSYKYTWGTRGAVWTGSEEWPGNQRLLEVTDVNGDKFVYRRDVFGDEATNKDRANLNNASSGTIGWTTDLHGCGPEVHERPFTPHTMCLCAVPWSTPEAIGPLTVACTSP